MTDKRVVKGIQVLRFVLQSTNSEIEHLNEFVDETANNLIKKQSEFEIEYKKAKEDKDFDQEMIDHFFDNDFYKYHIKFPTYTYNSLLVTLYSFFENRFRLICSLHQRNHYSQVKLSDLNGSDIEKCKKYLKLIAEVDFENLNSLWSYILTIQQIRNAIIHTSNNIGNEKKNENLRNLMKSDSRIEFSESNGNFYINDPEFLKEFNSQITLFFEITINKLLQSKVQARNTKMPFNNAGWGQEKSANIIKGIIEANGLLKTDFDIEQLNKILYSMTYDATKLLAFFSDGDWEPEDRDLIFGKGFDGLAELEKLYS